MINSLLKKNQGAATLIIATILIMTITVLVLFASSYTKVQTKVTANQFRTQQAFMAAEAGLEYGIVYFQANSATILASPSNGYIKPYTSTNTTNVTLANNSKFSVTYTNPIANNYTLITVTSTGTSDDGTATHIISQQIQSGSSFTDPTTNTAVIKGNISLAGNSVITNSEANTNLQLAGTLSMSGNSKTTTSAGTSSTAGNIKSDVQQNVSSLANMSSDTLFSQYFNQSMSSAKSQFANYYSGSGSTNYNTQLNGKTGTTIWIDQSNGEANLSGNITIGTATNPVLLVVNGSLNITGNVTIYGFVYIVGTSSATTDVTGNVSITGGIAVGANFNSSGNTSFTFNSSVISKVENNSGLSFYAKVPGSWKDF